VDGQGKKDKEKKKKRKKKKEEEKIRPHVAVSLLRKEVCTMWTWES